MSKCALVFTNLDLYEKPQEKIISKEKANKKIIKPNKLLLAALSVAFSIFGAIPSLAADTPPVPTLDKLHNAGTTIPDTAPPQIYPESAYTYTPADAPGTNTVTRYEKQEIIKYYDPTTGKEIAAADRLPDVEYKEITTIELVPKYYTVTLKQTEYGYKNAGGETKTFTVQTPSSDGTTDAFSYTINYYTDPARLAPDRITTNQNGADINNDFIEKSTTSYGGAIYNDGGTIGNITGDFIGNYASLKSSSHVSGGAIYNIGTIGNISGDFIGNYSYSANMSSNGGAIYNGETIGNITGDFIGNYSVYSGAIANGGKIGNIIGNFIGNHASSLYGGIYNKGEIGNISGDFIGNYVSSTISSFFGGAIFNVGTIGDITGDFIGNHVSPSSFLTSFSTGEGGAIYNNDGTIENITGNFIGNYGQGVTNASGGAIYIIGSNSKIVDITGDFIGNYASSKNSYSYGGAIYNRYGKIENITGDFIGNYASSKNSYVYGGAIYNDGGTIGNITGDFIDNYTQGSTNAFGGAIYNDMGTIGNIIGDFIDNYTQGLTAYGGAIYIYRKTISNVTGDFVDNYANGSTAYGGAIYNYATIRSITGNFIDNYAQGSKSNGGAIYNYRDTISNIKGDFIGNYVSGSYVEGGAVYNTEMKTKIGHITGDFIGNYAQGDNSASGGAIYNNDNSIFENITGDFISNYAQGDNSASGGAIYNNDNSIFENITGDFISNYAQSNSSSAYGGAIHNTGTIGNITGDFIGNYARGSSASGGAIYNSNWNSIGNITGDFIGNYAQSDSSSDANGGAIYISGGTITLTDSSFKDNYAAGSNAKGGAIWQSSGTTNIIADQKDVVFEGNFTASSKNPDGTFENKKSDAIYMTNGAINLNAKNNNIIFNDAVTTENGVLDISGTSDVVFNDSANLELEYLTINEGNVSLKGDTSLNVNTTRIGTTSSVNLDVINGKASTISLGNLTLYNDLNLKIDADLASDKIDSFDVTKLTSNGHSLNIEDVNITTDLQDKDYSVTSLINKNIDVNIIDSVDAYLTSNYKYDVGVYSVDNAEYLVFKKEGVNLGLPFAIKEKGNVVYSMTENETINSNWFVSSDIVSDKFTLNGNEHTITSTDGQTQGLILSANKELSIDNVKEISGFVSEKGGAINSSGTLNISNSTFNNNTAQTSGGAINSSGALNISNSTFSNNTASANGGALNISSAIDTSNMGLIRGSGVQNGDESFIVFPKPTYQNIAVNGINLVLLQKLVLTTKESYDQYKERLDSMIETGEAVTSISDIMPNGTVGAGKEYLNYFIKDAFTKVTLTYNGEDLGSYYMTKNISVGLELGLTALGQIAANKYTISNVLFENNIADKGGAVAIDFNAGDVPLSDMIDVGLISSETTNDLSSSYSSKEEALEAIKQMQQAGVIGNSMDDFISKDYTVQLTEPDVTFVNSSFVNNEAKSQGGAIYANTDLTIKADNGTSLFKGNKANGESNAIYMDSADKTLALESVNKGIIQFDDKINGQAGYNVKITGDNEKSQIVFSNNVDNAVVSSENITVTLNNSEVFKNSDFTINSGAINLINDSVQQHYAKSFNITGPINLNLDADLAAVSMDRLPENTKVSDVGKINVNNINLTSDSSQDITQILFAHDSYKDKVEHVGPSELSNATQTTKLFAPIYKYNVSYNPEDGMFTFVRGGGASSDSFEAFNPAVVAPSVAAQAGGYTTQVQTFNYAFQHADTFMNIPYLERVAMKNNNRYALSPTGDATDVGTFSPLMLKEEHAGFWVKPYASFENIPLNNGPKVSNINYGTLVGYDSPITSIAKGWERVITGYIGYNGASQRYQGVDNYQNGGILGSTATFYKGNFFNATTLSVGASVGDTTTMYGSENYTMLLAGIGNKTGYNFEFKGGKYIIQPSMLISYTFVNTFDYTNAAGLRIESDPLHAIQLAPGIKFIMNTKNGWQPYIGVNMIWNLLDDSKVTANDVRLPEMSIDPYVQYGVGVQKRFNDTFMAYGQAMINNGGRNGISFSAGLRWKVGKE